MQPKYCNVAATVGSQQFAINLQHTHTYTYFHCVCMYEARCMRRNLGCEHSRKKVVQKNTKAPFFFVIFSFHFSFVALLHRLSFAFSFARRSI